MAVQRRALTFNFEKSVILETNTPNEIEVAVAPLTEPNAPNLDASLVGPTQTQSVLLNQQNNTAIFYLVATDNPELTDRVPYRAAWREKYMGRQYTYDFVMPDFDTDFDSLEDLGNIIGGETYIQWVDRGRPGGVAGLNDAGLVVNADGEPVTGAAEAAVVQGNLDAEVVARQQADVLLRQQAYAFFAEQIAQVYTTTTDNLAVEANARENADLVERTARTNGDLTLDAKLAQTAAALNALIQQLNAEIDGHDSELDYKADLVDGKIPTSQIPSVALGKAVPVASEAAMLALTEAQVQPGDFAVRPDGVFFLNALPPSNINNWVEFTAAGTVSSVNGQTGAVVLGAADVSARPAAVAIPQADVTGLTVALQGKTNTATTTALTTRVSAIENDSTIVRAGVGGEINRSVSGSYLVYLDAQNRLTKKSGELLNVSGDGVFDIADVTGLQPALDSKQDKTQPATPTHHAASHEVGGADELMLDPTQVTGLPPKLTDYESRLASLEAESAGGTEDITKANWWFGSTDYNGVVAPAAFQTTHGVTLRGPFSKDGSGNFSYNTDGIAPGGHTYQYPYVTPNGHLQLREWNEANPADPAMATQAALDATNTAVSGKASQSALTALTSTVDNKADTSALNSTNSAVSTKAEQTALDATNAAVALKATQAALNNTNTTVGTKANQSDLTALTTTVGTKADKTGPGNTVPLAQIPALPQAQVTNLVSALAAKADLVSGAVPLTQLPSYPSTKVTGLDASLATKADLVGGKIPTAQIPVQALNTVVTVASKAAMLALNTTQVQQGDVCIITAGADKGSYILSGDGNPATDANWIKMPAPDDVVTSVQGQVGTVVLDAAAVGARKAGDPIAMTEVTNLTTTLGTKADTAAVNAALAGKTSATDVQSTLTTASQVKVWADLVSTTPVASLSGQQSIDGVLTAVGAKVLLTAQSSAVANGLYTVSSGSWQRVTDMAMGSYFVRGSLAIITSGVGNANTFWQETSDSGIVGTNSNNWSKVMTAGAPPNFTASLGVQRVSNDFRAQVVAGGGIQAVSGGLQLDPNVASRKYAADVPAGSSVVTITHGLNTTDVSASFRDKASGDFCLVGWKPTGVNTLSAEFAVAPTTGQYRVVCIG